MTTDENTPGLKEQNLRFVLLKAIADAAAEELGRLRAGHLKPMLERYDEDGTTSFRVRLPGSDSLIATVSLAVPKDKLEVDDEDAFVDWLASNHAEAVETLTIPAEPEQVITIPATEARTERIMVEKKVAAVMKQFKVTEDGIVDNATGMLVDGVKNVAGGRPRSFSVNYEPDGREQLAGAYRAGKLDDVVAGTSLPQVGARQELERRLEIVRVEQPIDVPVAPPEDQEPITPASLEEAFGEDAPFQYGDEVGAFEDPADVDVDALGPEYGDGRHPLPGERTELVSVPGDDDFDPGSW